MPELNGLRSHQVAAPVLRPRDLFALISKLLQAQEELHA